MRGAPVVELRAALDELLAIDPADLPDEELHQLVVDVMRQSHRLAAVRADLIASWEGRGIWSSDGSRSPGHRLARETSTSVTAAKTELRRAMALRSMPATSSALADGALSPQHVDLLAGAAAGNRRSLFEAHEELLVDQCRTLRFADAGRAVAYWMQRADAEATEVEGDRLHEARQASAATTLDGMVDLRALLDPVGGATFLDELVRLMEQLRLRDLADGVVRTATQRRARCPRRDVSPIEDGQRGRPSPPTARHRARRRDDAGSDLRAVDRHGRRPGPGRTAAARRRPRARRVRRAGPGHVRLPSTELRRRCAPSDRGPRPALPASVGVRRTGLAMRRRPHPPVGRWWRDEPGERPALLLAPQPRCPLPRRHADGRR